MGLFGIGRGSGQHEQAERNGRRAWEELQETREEVQGALQHEAGHVKEKADEQARGVKEQLEHLKGKAGGAAERGRQRGEQHADEVAEKASDTGSRLKRGTERGANAVAERASGTIDTVRDKAWQTKEGVKEKARRGEETVEEKSQHAKQEVKGKWWEKREKADRAAEETAQKTRSNIHAAEQTAAEKAEEAKRAAAEKAEQAKEAAQRGAQKVKGAAERSKEKLGEVKDKVGEKGQKLKGRVEETAEDLEEDAERTREAAARKAEEAKRTAAKPVWWLGRKADEGTDKIAEGVGAAKGVVSGTAQEAREAGRGLGAKLDGAADKVMEGAGYTAGYVEGTAEEMAYGAKHALERTRDVVGDDVRVTVKRVETPFISIHSKTVKELLAGGIAGAIAQTAAAPLEVVRTKLLGGRAGDNVKEVVKTLNRKSGRDWPIKQTTGSFGINVLRVALTKSVELVTYEKVKAKLKRRGRPGDHQIPLLDKLPRQVPESTWAGMAAGLANTLVAYPFETLKDRVLVMPEKYTGFGQALREVMLHEGGLPALYRGVVPALLGIVPQSAVNYYTYDTLKERYRKRTGRKHVPAGYTLLFGATAGAVSQLATYPLEVARKQVSVSVLPAVETGKAANAAYRNVVEAVRGVVRTEGVAGLYKGVGAQVAQVVPVAGLSWVIFETAKRALHAEEEDEDEDPRVEKRASSSRLH